VSEIVRLEYVQEEYNDGELYIPAKAVTFIHDAEEKGTLTDVVDTFKEFLLACGWLRETVDRVVIEEIK
jgi:hypothetical protein